MAVARAGLVALSDGRLAWVDPEGGSRLLDPEEERDWREALKKARMSPPQVPVVSGLTWDEEARALYVGAEGGAWLYVVTSAGVRRAANGVPAWVEDGLAPPDLPAEIRPTGRAQLPGLLLDLLPLPPEEREALALLLATWCIAVPLRPLVPQAPMLVLTGETGSGKTTLAQALGVLLVGPDFAPTNTGTIGRDPRDLAVLLAEKRLVVLDNLEGRRDSATLNTLAAMTTGAAQEGRQLYTDSEVVSLQPQARIIVTAMAPPLERGDIATRCMVVELPPRRTFRGPSEILEGVLAGRRAFWEALLHDTAMVLAAIERGELRGEEEYRMVEFARLGRIIARSLGREGEWDALLQRQRERQVRLALEGDPIFEALLSLLRGTPGGTVAGTAGDLARRLPRIDGRSLTGKRLAAWLRANAAHLDRWGLAVRRSEDRHLGQDVYRLTLLPHRLPAAGDTGDADEGVAPEACGTAGASCGDPRDSAGSIFSLSPSNTNSVDINSAPTEENREGILRNPAQPAGGGVRVLEALRGLFRRGR